MDDEISHEICNKGNMKRLLHDSQLHVYPIVHCVGKCQMYLLSSSPIFLSCATHGQWNSCTSIWRRSCVLAHSLPTFFLIMCFSPLCHKKVSLSDGSLSPKSCFEDLFWRSPSKKEWKKLSVLMLYSFRFLFLKVCFPWSCILFVFSEVNSFIFVSRIIFYNSGMMSY